MDNDQRAHENERREAKMHDIIRLTRRFIRSEMARGKTLAEAVEMAGAIVAVEVGGKGASMVALAARLEERRLANPAGPDPVGIDDEMIRSIRRGIRDLTRDGLSIQDAAE